MASVMPPPLPKPATNADAPITISLKRKADGLSDADSLYPNDEELNQDDYDDQAFLDMLDEEPENYSNLDEVAEEFSNPAAAQDSIKDRQEFAKQRNRENSRSTRKRRKLYVARLQKLINDLSRNLCSAQGESPASEKQLYHKYRAARCEAVQKFIQFRSEGIQDRTAWAKIISPKFILTQPILPFRAYADCERQGELYCCRGIDGLVADTALLKTVMTRLASSRAKRANCSCSVKVVYVVDPGEMLVALDKLMCKWQVHYEMVIDGKKMQVGHWGMCKCRFTTDHRLASVDLRYDVQGLMQQLENVMPVSTNVTALPTAFPYPNAQVQGMQQT